MSTKYNKMSIENLITIKIFLDFFINCPRSVHLSLPMSWVICLKYLVFPRSSINTTVTKYFNYKYTIMEKIFQTNSSVHVK